MKLKKTDQKGIYIFVCPGCDEQHQVWVEGANTKTIWDWNGSMENPTFSPSLKIWGEFWKDGEPYQKVCHSFIKDGKIQYLGDCTHELKNQTIELPEID